ncbi:MAG TPA: hypothetical protein VJ501_14460 [Burkholderiaceae bacterium]|nr:hypothetical protein [Burkholderiaceae bacterium]
MDLRPAVGSATRVPSLSPVARTGRAVSSDRLWCALWIAPSAAGWALPLVALGTLAWPN